jgi:hypothetical protein
MSTEDISKMFASAESLQNNLPEGFMIKEFKNAQGEVTRRMVVPSDFLPLRLGDGVPLLSAKTGYEGRGQEIEVALSDLPEDVQKKLKQMHDRIAKWAKENDATPKCYMDDESVKMSLNVDKKVDKNPDGYLLTGTLYFKPFWYRPNHNDCGVGISTNKASFKKKNPKSRKKKKVEAEKVDEE